MTSCSSKILSRNLFFHGALVVPFMGYNLKNLMLKVSYNSVFNMGPYCIKTEIFRSLLKSKILSVQDSQA